MARFYAHYSVIVPPDGDVKLFWNFCISLYSLAVDKDFWSHFFFPEIYSLNPGEIKARHKNRKTTVLIVC